MTKRRQHPLALPSPRARGEGIRGLCGRGPGERAIHIAWTALLALLLLMSLAAPAAQSANPTLQTVNGTVIYFGVMPAEMVRGHPANHPEASMHRNMKHEVAGDQHVVVALFDAPSGQRITDAKVTAFIVGVGTARSGHVLEKMTIAGAVTYGNYLPLPGPGPYRIRVDIARPGKAGVVSATFTYARADH